MISNLLHELFYFILKLLFIHLTIYINSNLLLDFEFIIIIFV